MQRPSKNPPDSETPASQETDDSVGRRGTDTTTTALPSARNPSTLAEIAGPRQGTEIRTEGTSKRCERCSQAILSSESGPSQIRDDGDSINNAIADRHCVSTAIDSNRVDTRSSDHDSHRRDVDSVGSISISNINITGSCIVATNN